MHSMREPRIHYPGAVYHVMSRGVERRVIFSSDTDRRTFLTYLIDAIQRFNLSVFAYCLMGNHFHMLLAVRDIPLETAMKNLLSHYALYFNWKHERVGHLFQGRYGALVCQNIDYIVQLIAYIHLNPVRAGLAPTPADCTSSRAPASGTGACRSSTSPQDSSRFSTRTAAWSWCSTARSTTTRR